MPGSRYAQYLLKLRGQINARPEPAILASYSIALQCVSANGPIFRPAEFVRQQLTMMGRNYPFGLVALQEDAELVDVLQATTFKSFNPQAWIRAQ
jgi:hypothetical protein